MGAWLSMEERGVHTEPVITASSQVVETARVLLQELTRAGWQPDPTVRNPNPCTWKILGCNEKGQSIVSLEVIGTSTGLLRRGVFDMEGLKNLTVLVLRIELKVLPDSIVRLSSLQRLYVKGNKLTRLPESIGKLTNLKHMILRGNRLKSLPLSIGDLASLRRLDLSSNMLATLPESIGHLAKLERLFLRNNRLISLPSSIGSLARLQELDISLNRLSGIPPSIGNLTGLVMCEVGSNMLTVLPEWIGNLVGLTRFILAGNLLSSLPASIGNLVNLKSLGLSNNRLSSLPESIGDLANLLDLNLSTNLLTSLPESIGNLNSLKIIIISMNRQLKALPESVGNLASLEYFFAAGTSLTTLPEGIGWLSSLIRLHITSNRISYLPASIRRLRRLEVLDFSHNYVETLPPDVFIHMKALRRFGAGDNRLMYLSGSLGSMSSLMTMDVSQNRLSALPDSIGNLTSLVHLDASANRLSSVPDSLAGLTRLRKLFLDDNMLDHVPAELISMKALVRLHLHNNRLGHLPRLTRSSSALDHLNLYNNRIRGVPDEWFQYLPALTHLDLSHNQLVDLPASLLLMDKLKVCELFANSIVGLSPGFWEWVTRLPTLSIALEDNRIVAGTGVALSVPKLNGKSEVYVDQVLISDSLGSEAFAARLLGVPDVNFVASFTPTTNGVGEECSFVTAVHEDADARVHIRECRCAKNYYRHSRTDPCLPCPRHSMCEDSKLRCYEGFYLRWLPSHASAECTPCPEHATCVDNEMHPTPGAWWDTRYALGDDVWTSPQNGTSPSVVTPAYQTNWGMGETVFECRNPEACLGGTNASCAVGYAGHLCSTCSDGYFSSGHGVCESCPDPGSSLGLAVLGGMTGLLVLAGLLFRGGGNHDSVWQGAGKHAESTRAGALLSGVGGVLGGNAAADDALTVVRVLVAFLQILVSLDVVFDVEWPDIMRVWDDLFGWVALDWLKSSSFECLWEYASRKWVGGGNQVANDLGYYAFSYYVSLVLTSGVPLLASVALLALYAVMGAAGAVFKEKHTLATIRERCLQMMLVIWMLAYLPVSSKAMGFFLCDSFNGGRTHWLHDDLSIQCYTPRYYVHAPVAAATLVVYTAGFPLLVIAGYLYHRWEQWQRRWRRQVGQTTLVNSIKLGAAWSTVSRAYRPEYGYWEAVEMARKLLVGAAAMHFGSTPTFQLTTALMVAFAAAVLHFYCRPYRVARAQRYAGANLILIYFTMSLGLLSRLDVDSGKRAVFAGTVLVLDAVFVTVLLVLILWDVGEAVRTQGWALVVHVFARVRMLVCGAHR